MISIVTQCAVHAVLSCMHVSLSAAAAADNGMDWSISLLISAFVAPLRCASPCLQALVCKQALLEMHVWPALFSSRI